MRRLRPKPSLRQSLPEPRLHLDVDASKKSLQRAPLEKSHAVTRTPSPWMPLNANDDMQLLGATSEGSRDRHASIILRRSTPRMRPRLPLVLAGLARSHSRIQQAVSP